MDFCFLRRKAYTSKPTTQKVKIRDRGKLSISPSVTASPCQLPLGGSVSGFLILAAAGDTQYIIKGNNHHQEH